MDKQAEVGLILLAGAAGGMVSTVDSWRDSFALSSSIGTAATVILIPAVKGALASGIGVYLLSTVDAAQFVRSIFFAVTCGLTFPSILSSGSSYASRTTTAVANSEIARASESVKTAATALKAASGSDRASAVTSVTSAAVDAIRAAPAAAPDAARAADSTAAAAVTNLGAVTNAASSPSVVSAIGQIGARAAANDLQLTAEAALNELSSIKGRPGVDPAIAREADLARGRIETARSVGMSR